MRWGTLKKYGAFLLCPILFAVSMPAGAESHPPRFGMNVEATMNSHKNCAFGRAVNVEFSIFDFMMNGVSLNASDDFTVTTVLEPSVFARKYFFTTLFVQLDLGMSVGIEKNNSTVTALAGIGAGFQCLLSNGDYFIEPYIRGGYPFIFGLGVRFGSRL
ncbi:MAG: hypothetical protein LBD24_02405 [Spirochaetaceae bacterium]|jgi:hypothetical protein|nr:hypothetical protein [Spirochaetaceae bacterium]